MSKQSKAPGPNSRKLKSCGDVVVKRVDPATGEIVTVGVQPAYGRDQLKRIVPRQVKRWEKNRSRF